MPKRCDHSGQKSFASPVENTALSDHWLSVEEVPQHLSMSTITVCAGISRLNMPSHRPNMGVHEQKIG